MLATNVILLSSSFSEAARTAQGRDNIDDDSKPVLRDRASSKKEEIVGNWRPAMSVRPSMHFGSGQRSVAIKRNVSQLRMLPRYDITSMGWAADDLAPILLAMLLLDSGQSDHLASAGELPGPYADLAHGRQAGTVTEESPPDQCPMHLCGRTDPPRIGR
jgi:hypothetical protein